jgi:PAS domain-containing protein
VELEILARIRRSEHVEHYETIRRRKDGSLVEVSVSMSPIKNSQGKTIGASKIARDITERKRAEQALRAAEENSEPCSRMRRRYFSKHAGRPLSHGNPAFARILGYDSPDDLIQHCTDIARQIYVDELTGEIPTPAANARRGRGLSLKPGARTEAGSGFH